jgi:hypothetical protein
MKNWKLFPNNFRKEIENAWSFIKTAPKNKVQNGSVFPAAEQVLWVRLDLDWVHVHSEITQVGLFAA